MAEEDDKLGAYRKKRSADRTVEPFGSEPETETEDWRRPRLFVVQKHAARRLHYDFRLEIDGVLHSWAVPAGLSMDPAEKRLAVEVEDHPVEYADFEGSIPEGNYGAGHVIVWDRGLWTAHEDPVEGLARGKLSFDLTGYKLCGLWHLFRTKGSPKDWLLVKKQDAFSGPEGARRLVPESIYSGLTLEELQEGATRASEIRSELQRLGAPCRGVVVGDVKLMLAETAPAAFSDPGWLFELKYDGYRLLAAREGKVARSAAAGLGARLVYRRGSDATALFPEVARAVGGLPYEALVLDGEVVVLDLAGRPWFQGLQRRGPLTRVADIARAAIQLPATYFAFDLLGFEDFDLRPLPLLERKRLLRRLLPRAGPLKYADHIEEQGEAFSREVEALSLEGVMAKRSGSPYVGRRSPDWLKLRSLRTGDFAVVGFTAPEGTRTGFGALHLAAWDQGRLVYVGRVGSGFSEEQLVETAAWLLASRREAPACEGERPEGRGHTWVEPERVCEVRYLELPEDHLLRQPVFLRFRDDKGPLDCPLPARERRSVELAPPAPAAVEGPDKAAERRVDFKNLDKVFWPDQGYTKGDLIAYYRSAGPVILPLLLDRPVVLTRYPDGISGKSFFQKDAPVFAPGWVRTERMWSEQAQREIDHLVCDDLETLLYLANLGAIPLHVWSSRVKTLNQPDWCILDLDPKGAPFTDVITLALAVRDLGDELELPTFVKTSGSTGIHVLVPLGRQLTYDQSKTLGQLLATVIAARCPEIATVVRRPEQRGGKVYLDFLQNGHGKLLAGAYSARPVPGALVSTPLSWDEVTPELEASRFTIRSLPERLASQARDPWDGVLALAPDLPRALERLTRVLASG